MKTIATSSEPQSDLKESYITQDIYIASSLHAWGFTLTKITQEGSKFLFQFDAHLWIPISETYDEAAGSAENLVDRYWKEELEINPKKLFNSFKEIKNRMYDLKRNNEGGMS